LVIEISLYYDARSEKHQNSFIMSVRLLVRMEQLDSHGKDFRDI